MTYLKKLTILFSLLPIALSAQTYVPFISTTDASDTWMDVNSCTDFSCFQTYKNRYTVEGDTTIGGLQYSKLYVKTEYEQGTVSGMWCSESIYYYEHYFGAIRENGKQVFLIHSNSVDSMEYLAYDFNLSIGDTLPSPTEYGSTPPANRIISSIDSVFAFGAYRKRFSTSSQIDVIEGIGASSGLFNKMAGTSSNCHYAMLCYSEYNTPDYFLEDCEMNLNANELSLQNEEIHPIKIVDYLGRETSFKPNTPLIYLYSDGSTKRIMRLEK